MAGRSPPGSTPARSVRASAISDAFAPMICAATVRVSFNVRHTSPLSWCEWQHISRYSCIAPATRRGRTHTPACAMKMDSRATGNSARRIGGKKGFEGHGIRVTVHALACQEAFATSWLHTVTLKREHPSPIRMQPSQRTHSRYTIRSVFSPSSISFQKFLDWPSAASSPAPPRLLRKRKSWSVFLCSTRCTFTWAPSTAK